MNTASVKRVTDRAIEVLGSLEKAEQWLSLPNQALGGRTPLSVLESENGEEEVLTILGRIDHGIFS